MSVQFRLAVGWKRVGTPKGIWLLLAEGTGDAKQAGWLVKRYGDNRFSEMIMQSLRPEYDL